MIPSYAVRVQCVSPRFLVFIQKQQIAEDPAQNLLRILCKGTLPAIYGNGDEKEPRISGALRNSRVESVLHLYDLTLIVRTAGLADSVRHMQSAAL